MDISATIKQDMSNKDTLYKFIQSRPHLVWYVGDLRHLSEESIVEHVLNYGTWEDFQELLRILGVPQTAQLFRKRALLKRTNYRPEIKNFFQLYFNSHAT